MDCKTEILQLLKLLLCYSLVGMVDLKNFVDSRMSEEVEKRYKIVRSIGEECVQEDELKNLLAKKAAPICYDGFEPSGRMHIAQVSYLFYSISD